MSDSPSHVTGTTRVKRGMAEMLKGGVIMDVVTPEQAKIAEDAGAVAVMALNHALHGEFELALCRQQQVLELTTRSLGDTTWHHHALALLQMTILKAWKYDST